MVHLEVELPGKTTSLTFTGDLGRRAQPILRDPAPVPACDLLLSESTYGGRNHGPTEMLAEDLGEIVRRTVERGGKLLIPAFSLGRTQTIVFFLHQLFRANKVPAVPIYVDSPLASAATEVFRLHPECFDEDTADLLLRDPDLFGGARIQYIRDVEVSKKLNRSDTPMVIIAASGMCEAGRVLHHLKNNIEDPRTTVLLVGYQAPHTLGRRLADKLPEVRLLDRTLKLRAEVVNLNGFSAHADHQDLLDYLTPLAGKTKKLRLVHGEPEPAELLAAALRQKGFTDVTVPDRGETVEVG
jgi:metallo-beta-lactamase family protein